MKLKDFTFLFALLILALFDALFGGALAAILQHEGWQQRINDIWQIGFGTVCALTALVFFLVHRAEMRLKRKMINSANSLQDARWQAIYLLAMLLAYAEDLIFYPALWVLNDIGVTSLISGGYEYDFPRFLWPWSLSGWFGFVTRWVTGATVKLPTIWAMVLSFGALAVIIWHSQYQNRKDKP